MLPSMGPHIGFLGGNGFYEDRTFEVTCSFELSTHARAARGPTWRPMERSNCLYVGRNPNYNWGSLSKVAKGGYKK